MTDPLAMTVDVEEHFHAAALAPVWPRAVWDTLPSRVTDNTCLLLDCFAATGVRGTFFILGCVAERHPALVRAIAAAGHEIASHGHGHARVGELTPAEFRDDVGRSRTAIEDAAGVAVSGYRAPNFSIDSGTWWAYEILRETGYRYSSSVNPVLHDHYGVPDAPRTPFRPLDEGMVEIPVATAVVLGARLPAGGGGYFRLIPFAGYRWLLNRAEQTGVRGNFYTHPWEFDPGQPRAAVKGLSRFRHYVNLSRNEAKLRRLLAAFPWGPMREVYAGAIESPQTLDRWNPPAPALSRAA